MSALSPKSSQCRTVARLANDVAAELEKGSRGLSASDPRLRSLRREMRALAAVLPDEDREGTEPEVDRFDNLPV